MTEPLTPAQKLELQNRATAYELSGHVDIISLKPKEELAQKLSVLVQAAMPKIDRRLDTQLTIPGDIMGKHFQRFNEQRWPVPANKVQLHFARGTVDHETLPRLRDALALAIPGIDITVDRGGNALGFAAGVDKLSAAIKPASAREVVKRAFAEGPGQGAQR